MLQVVSDGLTPEQIGEEIKKKKNFIKKKRNWKGLKCKHHQNKLEETFENYHLPLFNQDNEITNLIRVVQQDFTEKVARSH